MGKLQMMITKIDIMRDYFETENKAMQVYNMFPAGTDNEIIIEWLDLFHENNFFVVWNKLKRNMKSEYIKNAFKWSNEEIKKCDD